MHSVSRLFDLVSAPTAQSSSSLTTVGRSERLLLATLGLVCAMVFAALWGLAASSASFSAACANAFKVPMLLVVSGAVALPVVLLFCRLVAPGVAAGVDLLVGYAVAVFGGTLVLAVLAPLVALYQHSSSFIGPRAALASVVLAVIAGCAIFVRALGRLVGSGGRRGIYLPVAAMVLVQLAALAQLASVVSPVFPTRTAFGRGIDGVSHVADTEDAR